MNLSKGWKIGLSIILIAIIGLSSTIVVLNLPERSDIPDPDTAPVLKNLGVTFGNYSEETSQAGSFLFIEDERIEKLFVEFGEEAIYLFGNSWKSIMFEYLVAKDSNVYAVCNGVVEGIRHRSDIDTYEVTIGTGEDSHWFVTIGFLINLTVKIGDEVKAGDIIGKPYEFSERLGRFGLWLGYNDPEENPKNGFYAPFLLFDTELRETYEAKVWQLMEDWENFKHNWTLYDQDSMVYAGCLNETIKFE